jgi:hypothetical protein
MYWNWSPPPVLMAAPKLYLKTREMGIPVAGTFSS